MIDLGVTIEDMRTGQEETRHIESANRTYREGVIIGSAEDCDVRLVGPGVTAHHVRWYAGGYHRFLEILSEDAVVSVSEGEDYRRGDYLRIDSRAFRVSPYRLQI
jgi:hypothetical protein